MRGKSKQEWGIADRVTSALEHAALQIVIEKDPRDSPESSEGLVVSQQKDLGLLAEEEAQEDASGIREDKDKGHQGAHRATDLEMSEMSPVDLALFARQSPQSQIGLRLWLGAYATDDAPKMTFTTAIPV